MNENGLLRSILDMAGYTPVPSQKTETVTTVIDGVTTVNTTVTDYSSFNWSWGFAAVSFLLVLLCVLKIVGGVLCRK